MAELRLAEEHDVPAISRFMIEQGQSRCSPEYLVHWYFRNPSGHGLVMLAELNSRIVGMASANTHIFQREDEAARVWMPQKVLSATDVRGHGIFGRLQRAVDEQAVHRGADFFLTVTNAASTPIFLSRFQYARALSPRMLVWTPRPPSASRLQSSVRAPSHVLPAWAMRKTAGHHQWRYQDPLGEYVSERLQRGGDDVGAVHVRIVHKRRVPVMLLLDVVTDDEQVVPELIDHARALAWQRRCAALLSLMDARLEANQKILPRALRTSSRLNLLVRGLRATDTDRLAADRFALMFGDLDFV